MRLTRFHCPGSNIRLEHRRDIGVRLAALQSKRSHCGPCTHRMGSLTRSTFLPAAPPERISTAGASRPQGPLRVVAERAPAGRSKQRAQAVVCFTDASEAEGANLVEVRFSTHFQAAFGEQLKLVGSHQAVGEWDVGSAPCMHWTDGHIWTTSVKVPEGTEFEYKVVHVHHNGVCWEQNQNRQFKVAAEVAEAEPAHHARLAAIDVLTAWNQSQPLKIGLVTADEEQEGARLAGADSETGAAASASAWDPSSSGLPADLTAELTAPSAAVASEPISLAETVSAAVARVTEKVFKRPVEAPAQPQIGPSAAEPTPATSLQHTDLAAQPATELAPRDELSSQAAAVELPAAEPAAPAEPAAEAAAQQAEAEASARLALEEEAEAAHQAAELSKATAVVAIASQALAKEWAAQGIAFTEEELPTSEAPEDADAAESMVEELAVTPSKPSSTIFDKMGKAAGYAALGVAATVVMSALAIDITDAAVASAVVAAGAAVLPASTASGTKKAYRGKGGAGDAALGAIALGMGAAESLARTLQAKSQPRAQASLDDWADAEDEDEFDAADASLAASIAEAESLLAATPQDVAEAEAFAISFKPTTEQLVNDYGVTTLHKSHISRR
ncbi:hypothetical protein WJX72_010426 [[Myrmecia] bisecta]|uniref:CBM20 domain-containing protein n=1 Tax=[Myrmecia] bisecta TaxID=41462 RepID=A0AAW1QT95_9CHLO